MSKVFWALVGALMGLVCAIAVCGIAYDTRRCLCLQMETNKEICWEHETVTVPLEDWQDAQSELKNFRERDRRCGRQGK